jgi:hypothetical protein
MTPLRRSALAATVVVIVSVGAACDSGGAFDHSGLDLAGAGYVPAGAEFWDGWRVPVGTVLLGTPFPEPRIEVEGISGEPYRISAEFFVTGDPHDVMRDLYDQVEGHGYRPMVDEWNLDTSVCSGWPSDGEYYCHLYGRVDDFTKFEAQMDLRTATMTDQPRERLWVTIGEFPDEAAQGSYTDWVDADRPQDEALLQPREIEVSGLEPGDEMPFYGRDEAVGEIPDGARMLAPSYNPSTTYGFAGIFAVTDDQALVEFEEIAAGAATGERYPDEAVTAGDLTAQHISWDGAGGGCMVTLDAVELPGSTIARLEVICD